MSLEEVQQNYEYLIIKFDIRNIIISWGEPSLHPDFWRLMIFFYYKINPKIRPALNTNGILFSQERMVKKLEKLIRLSPLPRKQISLSFSNIANPTEPKNKKEIMKINGIRNLLGADFWNTRIFLSVIITRENYTHLKSISEYIKTSINIKNKEWYHVDIRYVFIGSRKRWKSKDWVFLESDEYAKVMPESFSDARKYIEDFIYDLHSLNISLSLKNLPICNFWKRIHNIYFSEYTGENRISVSSLNQLQDIESVWDYFNAERTPMLSLESCKNCIKNKECSIEKEYLDIGIFDNFSTIYNEEKNIV